MNKTPKVVVIMPAYNAAQTLAKTFQDPLFQRKFP